MTDDQRVFKTLPENAVIAELAHRAAGPSELEPGKVYLLPNGQALDLLDSEDTRLARPRRRTGLVVAHDAESFGTLVRDLGPEHGVVRIYGDPFERSFTAVLNDHDGDQPGWGDHRLRLTVRRTESWRRWVDGQGLMDQHAFAEHVEMLRGDIADPPAADMLEIAQTIEATIDAQFRGGARLKDGARQLAYVETVNATAGSEGHLTVPDSMLLCLAPFEGGDPVNVEARIRFQIRSGKLSIGYVLHRVDEIERAAFSDLRAVIETSSGVAVVLGTPPVA